MPLKELFTISEAAQKLHVSRQRMHKLIETYKVKTEVAGPIKLVSLSELNKIPAVRPSGKKVG